MNVDKHHVLDEDVFSYSNTKENTLFIYWHGKQVKVIKGAEAQKFLAKVVTLDRQGAQLLMAKLTGNFKRGNER